MILLVVMDLILHMQPRQTYSQLRSEVETFYLLNASWSEGIKASTE